MCHFFSFFTFFSTDEQTTTGGKEEKKYKSMVCIQYMKTATAKREKKEKQKIFFTSFKLRI
jgi:hypothetical protein